MKLLVTTQEAPGKVKEQIDHAQASQHIEYE